MDYQKKNGKQAGLLCPVGEALLVRTEERNIPVQCHVVNDFFIFKVKPLITVFLIRKNIL